MNDSSTIPLLENYPGLRNAIPHIQLGDFPTPIKKMELLGRELGIRKLYIKRDDLSGKIYGGNKIRKLEFLLGQAIQDKTKKVFTFGAAGSNHALATAIYCKELGLDSSLFLLPQPNARYVRNNLLMALQSGAEINYMPGVLPAMATAAFQSLKMKFQQGSFTDDDTIWRHNSPKHTWFCQRSL
jgi:1-aminocyclopropane-1-carboxylate deaminase/D-cysteine desulfhydrase-like pyridoxal-dependent ACC family enzyme